MPEITYDAVLPAALDADGRAALAPALVALWEESVRASHDFLAPDEVEKMRPEVADALFGANTLLLAYEGERPVGFCAVSGDMIDALFVHPQAQGKGVGSALCRQAIEWLGAVRVDVNEQNAAAHAFYEHVGFAVESRSATDDAGRPYPLLHLRLAAR